MDAGLLSGVRVVDGDNDGDDDGVDAVGLKEEWSSRLSDFTGDEESFTLMETSSTAHSCRRISSHSLIMTFESSLTLRSTSVVSAVMAYSQVISQGEIFRILGVEDR